MVDPLPGSIAVMFVFPPCMRIEGMAGSELMADFVGDKVDIKRESP